jgi:hypothetical protein
MTNWPVKLPPWRHCPLLLALVTALFPWWLEPTGSAIFRPLVLTALFAVALWILRLRNA